MILDFIPDFLSAFVTNIWVAAASLTAGLLVGLPLALMRHGGAWLRWPAGFVTSLLRAAPTFVVMFFVLNMLAHDTGGAPPPWWMSPDLVLIMALGVYAAGYVSDSGHDALRHLSAGERGAAMLFIPNVVRAFFVLVMASSTGAAIGVHEAVSTTLRQADRITSRGYRILLVVAVILFFTVVLQTANLAVRALARAAMQSGRRSAHAEREHVTR